jgi:hypothetical protein
MLMKLPVSARRGPNRDITLPSESLQDRGGNVEAATIVEVELVGLIDDGVVR